jgi:hypothetical protein
MQNGPIVSRESQPKSEFATLKRPARHDRYNFSDDVSDAKISPALRRRRRQQSLPASPPCPEAPRSSEAECPGRGRPKTAGSMLVLVSDRHEYQAGPYCAVSGLLPATALLARSVQSRARSSKPGALFRHRLRQGGVSLATNRVLARPAAKCQAGYARHTRRAINESCRCELDLLGRRRDGLCSIPCQDAERSELYR